jgi:hypothetical protein
MQKTLIVDNHDPLGINLLATCCGRGVYVNQFYRSKDSSGAMMKLLAEKSGIVQIGDFISTINGQDMTDCTLAQTRELCRTRDRPLVISFKPVEADHDINSILGDARKVQWIAEYFDKPPSDSMQAIHLAHELHNIVTANVNEPSPHSGKALLHYLTLTLSQQRYEHLLAEADIACVVTRLQRRDSGDISPEALVDLVHTVYKQVYQIFEHHLGRFLPSISANRMFAHFARDSSKLMTSSQLASCLAIHQFAAFLQIFCSHHNW